MKVWSSNRQNVQHVWTRTLLRPYSKANLNCTRKTELECRKKNLICACTESFFFVQTAELQKLKFEFFKSSWGRTADKLTINWQNFAQVGLQLKFAFRKRLFIVNMRRHILKLRSRRC